MNSNNKISSVDQSISSDYKYTTPLSPLIGQDTSPDLNHAISRGNVLLKLNKCHIWACWADERADITQSLVRWSSGLIRWQSGDIRITRRLVGRRSGDQIGWCEEIRWSNRVMWRLDEVEDWDMWDLTPSPESLNQHYTGSQSGNNLLVLR